MIEFLIKLKLVRLKNNPIRIAENLFLLIFVVFNLYFIRLLANEPPLSDFNINLFICLLPLALVLLSDFVPRYKFNVFLLSGVYPVSNPKNAGLVLFNDFFSFIYGVVFAIFLELLIVFDFSLNQLVGLSALVLGATIVKFFIHYFVFIIKKQTVVLLLSSVCWFAIQLFFFFSQYKLATQFLPLVILLITYLTQFKHFRKDFTIGISKTKSRYFNRNSWMVLYSFRTYKNLFTLYFIIKISFILIFSIFYQLTKDIFISPMALVTVLSPIFLYAYFQNNYFVLNNRVNKNLFLAHRSSRVLFLNVMIIFFTSFIDLILSIPALIVFGWNYIVSYFVLFFSFTFSSVFISLYFPKERMAANLWLKGTTSSYGIILYFIYIAFVASSAYPIEVKLIPIFISAILFVIAAYNFEKKQVSIFENFKC
jgi:hypothetical protein